MAARLPVHKIGTPAKELTLGDAKAYHLPNWGALDHPGRLRVIRQIAEMRGRDPRVAQMAVSIIKASGAQPREYTKQAAALLKWVQEEVYYVNEPGERLQDPIYTLKSRYGDCDDTVLLLGSLFTAIGMPWKMVLSGRLNGQKVRHLEGQPVLPNVVWAHIYLMVGTPSFNPTQWYFCETTIRGVPLGWDVVSGDASFLPEMVKPPAGPPRVMNPGRAPAGFKPRPMPVKKNRSPAYDVAYSDGASASAVGAIIGAKAGASMMTTPDALKTSKVNWAEVQAAVVTNVVVGALTALLLDWVAGSGIWADTGGHLLQRLKKAQAKTLEESVFAAPAPLAGAAASNRGVK